MAAERLSCCARIRACSSVVVVVNTAPVGSIKSLRNVEGNERLILDDEDTINGERSVSEYRKTRRVFSQGDAADAVYYVQQGQVKAVSPGSEARRPSLRFMGRETFSAKAV